MSVPQLPREIWIMILNQKRTDAWKMRKLQIQKLLHSKIFPYENHSTSFLFRGHQVYYFRTDHVDITIELRRGEIFLFYVLNVHVKKNGMVNVVQLRFVHCPVHRLL